jgi:4-amino-4-deoxy-L-arabinose transferase-like glycosyltransferase
VEILGAAFLALMAALFVASDVLERVPHVQDSITYLFQAQTMAGGRLTAPAPALPEFFEQEFLLVRDGRWYGKYSPGFPAVLALGVLLKQSWLINPILAMLTIPLIYGLGLLLFGPAIGRLGALLALASPFFLLMSGSMMAHPAELLWMSLFMYGWVRSLRSGRDDPEQSVRGRRWIFIAGLALGMAFLTRTYTALAVSLPFVAITGLAQARNQATSGYRFVAMRAALLLAVLLPFILLLLGYQRVVTGDPFQDPRLLYWEFDRPGFGPQVGMGHNAFTLSEFEDELVVNWFRDPAQPPNGHTPARGVYNTEQNWRALETHLFGWPAIFTLAFCWLAFLARRPSWFDVALLLAAATLIAAYTLFWSSGIMYGPRYYYAAMPAFLLLSARGIQAAGAWVGGRAGAYAVAGLTAALVLGNFFFYLPQEVEEYRGYNFISGQPLSRAKDLVQGKGIVFVETSGDDWWDYGAFFSGNTPWLDGDVIYARDLGPEKNRSLLARFPQYRAYQWRDGELGATEAGTPQVGAQP